MAGYDPNLGVLWHEIEEAGVFKKKQGCLKGKQPARFRA